MRILVVTDAWHPQVNGVVNVLSALQRCAPAEGAELVFLTPDGFPTLPMPSYPDIRLAFARPRAIARRIAEARADAIHIITEGPLGHAVRSWCLKHKRPFTTSFHTRFAEYVSARWPIPESWVWSYLLRFHNAGEGVMAGTPALAAELSGRGFRNVMLWPRGVDATLFRPRPDAGLDLPKPIFLSVGRLAVEKNLDAFLALDLPGSKVVVGDGPQAGELERNYPQAHYLGLRKGKELARIYAAADVFVFPSRTDTFGLVLLEALASGVPVAALPVTGPRDVIGDAPVGRLDDDLRAACLGALSLSRDDCRAFAQARSWEDSARAFVANVRRVAAGRVVPQAA